MFTSPQERQASSGTFAYGVGVFFSFALHMGLAVLALIVLEHSRAKASEIVEVFSVTLEGGEKLGGMSQIPSTENSPAPKVSPVSSIEKKEEVAPPIKKEEKTEPPPEEKASDEKPTEETELPEMKQKEIEEATMLEEKRRKDEEVKKKKEDQQRKVEEERKIKQEEDKKRKAEDEKKKKEQEEKERLEQEKKDQARKDKERKERDDKFRKAIESAQQRSDGTSKSDYKGESANAGGQGWGAAALGGKGMGGGSVRPLEFVAYVNRIEQHIKGGWRWIKGADTRLQAVVAIRLAPSGVVQEASIARSSGNSQFDDSALRAVYKASPVPPPPESLYDQFRETRITFDSQE